VPRAPGFFFFLRGPQLAVVKLFFKSNYLITFAKINSKRNPVNTFSRGPRSAGGAQGPNAGKDATDWIFVAFASYRKNIQLGPARIHGPPLLDVTGVASYLTVNVSSALHPELFIQTPLL